jgi:peptidoglycan/xylan/chitin deacetylase (PgdA/CDA1 family)
MHRMRGKRSYRRKKQRIDSSVIVVVIFLLFTAFCCAVLLFVYNEGGEKKGTFFKFGAGTLVNGRVSVSDLSHAPAGGIVSYAHKQAIIERDGSYFIDSIKPGWYSVSVSFNDIIMVKDEVFLKKGENRVDFLATIIIPPLMRRHIPEGMTDEEIFKPVAPRVYRRGNPAFKRVAITIDDGWFEDNKLLDLLNEYGIRCTVFIIGGMGIGNKRPHWIKKMDDIGFEVCGHTMSHSIITELSDEKLEEELRQCQNVISGVTHAMYPYFRPPFGIYDDRTLDIIARNGYKIIHWSNSINDTLRHVRKKYQVSSLLKNLKNGDIIISHFGAYNTYEVMKEIIPEIWKMGYEIVTVSEVLKGMH